MGLVLTLQGAKRTAWRGGIAGGEKRAVENHGGCVPGGGGGRIRDKGSLHVFMRKKETNKESQRSRPRRGSLSGNYKEHHEM